MPTSAGVVPAMQVVEYMQKEHQLMELFKKTNLADNLAAASSAAAAAAQLSATHQNAAAASSAAAVLAQLVSAQQNMAAASSAAAALGQLSATQQGVAAASSTAAAMAQSVDMSLPITDTTTSRLSAVGDSVPAAEYQQPVAGDPQYMLEAGATTAAAAAGAAVTAADALTSSAAPGLGSVLADLSSKLGKVVQHVVPQLSSFSLGRNSSSAPEAAAEAGSSLLLEPSAVLAQLQVLQQRLPTQQDKARMLQDYQAWLDSVKDCLLQQHEQTQVRGGCGMCGDKNVIFTETLSLCFSAMYYISRIK